MSVGTAGQASKGMDYSAIFRSVCTNYTTKSLVTLQRNFRQMHPSFRFVDPFVDASPKQEALLQFMSLQRIFSTVTADFTTPILVEQRGPLTEVKADVHFEYVWNRGAVTKLFLPEKTIVEATVEIMVDTASGLVCATLLYALLLAFSLRGHASSRKCSNQIHCPYGSILRRWFLTRTTGTRRLCLCCPPSSAA